MKNIAYIYQPHFKTQMFRAAVTNQQGTDFNYVVVTCAPNYNGVWKYNANNKNNYDIWKNGKKSCYEIPIKDCTLIKELKELINEDIIKNVKKQQEQWFLNEIKNRNYEYKDRPEWFI